MIKKRRSLELLKVVMGCKGGAMKPKKGKGSFKRQYRNDKDAKNYVRG